MVSDYFYDPNTKHTEEKKIEYTVTRLTALKEYLYNKLFRPIEDLIAPANTFIPVEVKPVQNASELVQNESKNRVWTVVSKRSFSDPCKDRFYINSNYFETFVSEWTQKNKVKLEKIDWLYLIFQVVKTRTEDNPGYNVSWADGTLGICLDIPDVCKQ